MPIHVLSALYTLDFAAHNYPVGGSRRAAAKAIGEYLLARGYEEAAKFRLGDAEFRL